MDATLEQLLDLLDVRLDAFAMCEIESGFGLRCQPLDMVVVHFVLRGEGTIECEHGSFPLRPGMIVVVPRHLPKTIAGSKPAVTIVDATAGCPLVDGMVRFRACKGEADLVLGCASVTARIGHGFGLFDHLQEPLAEDASDTPLGPLFQALLGELSRPKVGTRAVAGTLMKHVLIVLLRAHFSRKGMSSPLHVPMGDPQLGKAMIAIVTRPGAPYSVESLARLAGMGCSSFARHFSATYGRSPMEFVQSVRLQAATRLLRGSDLPIKSIASTVGFASRSHFSRAFRAAHGVDPTRYRATPDQGLGFEEQPVAMATSSARRAQAHPAFVASE